MNDAEVLEAIERIERDLARLQAEAATLRAHVTSKPPPAPSTAASKRSGSGTRRETLAFPSLSEEEGSRASPASTPPLPRAPSVPTIVRAEIATDTLPPLPRTKSSPRTSRSRDTMPAPPEEGSGVRRPVGKDEDEADAGRYGFVAEPRSKVGKPR